MSKTKYRYAVTTEDGNVFYTNDEEGLNRWLEQEGDGAVVLDMQEDRRSFDMVEWHDVEELEVPAADPDEDEDDEDSDEDGEG